VPIYALRTENPTTLVVGAFCVNVPLDGDADYGDLVTRRWPDCWRLGRPIYFVEPDDGRTALLIVVFGRRWYRLGGSINGGHRHGAICFGIVVRIVTQGVLYPEGSAVR